MTIRVRNGWKAVAIAVVAATFAAAGGYYVLQNRRPILLRQQVFKELSDRRELLWQRREIERRLVELKALPRITLRARDLLGMRPPTPDESIRAEGCERGWSGRPEEGKR